VKYMGFKTYYIAEDYSNSIERFIEKFNIFLKTNILSESFSCDLKEEDLTPEQKEFVDTVARVYARTAAWNAGSHINTPIAKQALQINPETHQSEHPYAVQARNEMNKLFDLAIEKFGDCGADLISMGSLKVREYFAAEKNAIEELMNKWVRSPQNKDNKDTLTDLVKRFGPEHAMPMYQRHLEKMYGTA
jgi:hypothetical protein